MTCTFLVQAVYVMDGVCQMFKFLTVVVFFWFSSSALHAQTSLPSGAIASVNGVAIPTKLLDQLVSASTAQGLQDSPQLRNAIKTELIAKELFWQEAQKRGLDKTPEATAALAQLRQNVLIDFLIQDEIKQKPLTEAEIKSDYDRQIANLSDAQQYQLRQAVFSTEAEAKAAIASVRSGVSLAKLAKDKSLDASKSNEGLMDWLLPNQIVPAVSNVIVNLGKGAMAATPIQVGDGWHVIRVEDTRKFAPPTFEQAKEGIRAALQQKRRFELLGELSRKAKVEL
ncbi:peptidyl-prolyl cis-trans isomerase [Limnohabitans sp. 15K]|uniref:peptidylprolyl isomerase n=1 Tax=Limnohabitans sp. 15K TaxID=1100706 RepID=UPI00117B05E1|nr:peptidylprolyl isomerase [Limnohabitans sp. 15K]